MKSTRFPGKILADIDGKPMLWHVYQGASLARRVDDIWIVTDCQEVYDQATSWGAKVLMTEEHWPSGTARIASVSGKLYGDIIINVQGDEPLISGEVIDSLIESLENSNADVATPVFPITDIEDIQNPNVVKVVRGSDGNALYFSRSAIPYVRDMEPKDWLSKTQFWGHTGVYAYRKEVLTEYFKLPEGTLEKTEKLEQLRVLEAGRKILTVEIDYRTEGVDTPADLEKVKKIINDRIKVS